MSDRDEKSDTLYKMDTVPPPPGEDDAYSATTKVGPMSAAVIEEIKVAAKARADQRKADRPRPILQPISAPVSESPPSSAGVRSARVDPRAEEPPSAPRITAAPPAVPSDTIASRVPSALPAEATVAETPAVAARGSSTPSPATATSPLAPPELPPAAVEEPPALSVVAPEPSAPSLERAPEPPKELAAAKVDAPAVRKPSGLRRLVGAALGALIVLLAAYVLLRRSGVLR